MVILSNTKQEATNQVDILMAEKALKCHTLNVSVMSLGLIQSVWSTVWTVRSSPTKITQRTNRDRQWVEVTKNVCVEMQFLFIDYSDAELTRILWTYEAHLVFLELFCIIFQ